MSSEAKPRDSLVQYEPPIEMTQNSDISRMLGGKKRAAALPPLESKPSTEDILNAILPPREWDYEGKHFIQYCSHAPAQREDVANLQKLLDERLLTRQARETGICAIREELLAQCFDEIIRQVTIDCPERGLLLMRVRDELKMTIAAYQTLYNSSVEFGMRKQIQSEIGKAELEAKIASLELKKQKLEEKRVDLLNKKESLEKRIKERNMLEEQKRNWELAQLKSQASNLESFLRSVANQAQQ